MSIEAGQREARQRGCRDRSRSGGGREQRELVLPGSRRRRARAGWEARRSRHCDGGLPGFAADPPPHADERPHDETDQGGRPRARGGLRPVHRHGIRSAVERALGSHVQPELRGAERNRGRSRLPVQPRDRGSDGGSRSYHGSTGARQISDIKEPTNYPVDTSGFEWPPKDRSAVQIVRGPNIAPLPVAAPPKDSIEGEGLIRLGDNISTDHIMPAWAKILPFPSTIPAIANRS